MTPDAMDPEELDTVELRIPPGTVVHIAGASGVPVVLTATAAAITNRGNLGMMPVRVLNHTNTPAPQAEPPRSDGAFTFLMILVAVTLLLCLLVLTGVVK